MPPEQTIIAANGDSPITRRECGERHAATVADIQRSLGGVKWTVGAVGAIVCLVITATLNLAVSAHTRIGEIEVRTARDVAAMTAEVAKLPTEVPPEWFRHLVEGIASDMKALQKDTADLKLDIGKLRQHIDEGRTSVAMPSRVDPNG